MVPSIARRKTAWFGSIAAALAVAWTILVGISLSWNIYDARKNIHDLAVVEGRATIAKEDAFRHWAAGHGGVYVPITEKTQPNPYLADIPERDITTPSGKRLTLMNSAYMLRQVHEQASHQFGEQGHLTSLNPVRPENAPDDWERRALTRIEKGAQNVDSVEILQGSPHMRLMYPVRTEESCFKCHASRENKIGDLRGGISVSVPLAPYLAIEQRQVQVLWILHAGLWILGLGGILFTMSRISVRVRKQKQVEADLLASGLEKARLEQQILHGRKLEALGQLAGGVAHDFNNLLMPILGYASLAMEELPQGSPLRDDMEQIRLAAVRARDLTRRLLAFGRKQVLEFKLLSLSEVVDGLQPMLRRLIGEDLEIAVDLQPSLPAVRADQAQIELVLVNLAVNARDAMSEGGTLHIATREERLEAEAAVALDLPEGCYVSLTVADTGCGMGDEVRAHLFEPFYTTKAAGKGTGLGLATVHGVVRQHGGAITVDTEVGRGTVFRILLPVSKEQVADAESSPPAVPRGNETVLVAEDDESVRRLVGAALSGLGYRVILAESGDEALRIAADLPAIDLLLTDVVMPHMSGRELYDRLAALRPGIRLIYMSGHTKDVFGPHATPPEGVSILLKPFAPDELGRAIRRALDSERPPLAS